MHSSATLLVNLTDLIAGMRSPEVLRVAIDGPDAAGKTTLADALAGQLEADHEVVRMGIDGFHLPREVRHRRGPLSPEGYYEDSFDYDAIRRSVLRPLGPGGDRRYRRAVFDHRTDLPRDEPVETADVGAVLLFDGVFLLRPELRDWWDLRIYLDISAEEMVRRALVRDLELFGTADTVRERYDERYVPGQRLYRQIASPKERADVLIDNNNPEIPRILAWPTPSPPAEQRGPT